MPAVVSRESSCEYSGSVPTAGAGAEPLRSESAASRSTANRLVADRLVGTRPIACACATPYTAELRRIRAMGRVDGAVAEIRPTARFTRVTFAPAGTAER